MPSSDLTPMMQQYHALKAQHPGTLLLFRLGDFYELFYEDAEIAARDLEITLTSRELGKGRRIPMCGVPYHAVTGYVARLIDRGHRVALCDQVEDPRRARGLVRREIVRIITPGTVMEEGLLPPRTPAYIAALHRADGRQGLAAVDLSTGEFTVTEEEEGLDGRLWEEIARLEPRELLLAEGSAEARDDASRHVHVTRTEAWRWDRAQARRVLVEHFRVATLDGFGAEDLAAGVSAAGALLQYLLETQRSPLPHLRTFRHYHLGDFLLLDDRTRANLELVRNLRDGGSRHTVLEAIDRTVTAMGGRLLRSWLLQPLYHAGAINARLDAVADLASAPALREEVRAGLRPIGDLARLVGRIGHGSATPRDLLALRAALERLPALRGVMAGAAAGRLRTLAAEIDPHDEVAARIRAALVDDPPPSAREGGIIRDGYDPELDTLRAAARDGKRWIAALEGAERARTGIKSLRVGFNKIFGYYLEVSRTNLPLVPADYIRKQTVVNGERFITQEMKEREAQILGAEERISETELRLFAALREAAAEHAGPMLRTAAALAEWDVLAGLSETAATRGFTRPALSDDPRLVIEGGRHAVVEAAVPAGSFVPNDLELDVESRAILLVTGPNMAGKSVYCRQAALLVILAQMGSFVPAAAATVGLTDRIFARVGATDDTALGRSTFLVEMQEVAAILHNATRHSLIILDEVGRGTSTYDGMSLAWAVVEYLHETVGARTLFATHFHELTELGTLLPRVDNVNVLAREQGEEVVFLHRVAPGPADRSYGIHVARLAGIPHPVIAQARRVLAHLEAVSAGPAAESTPQPLPARARGARQVSLPLDLLSPIEEELLALGVESMSPLEALNKLADLRDRVRVQRGGPDPRPRRRVQ